MSTKLLPTHTFHSGREHLSHFSPLQALRSLAANALAAVAVAVTVAVVLAARILTWWNSLAQLVKCNDMRPLVIIGPITMLRPIKKAYDCRIRKTSYCRQFTNVATAIIGCAAKYDHADGGVADDGADDDCSDDGDNDDKFLNLAHDICSDECEADRGSSRSSRRSGTSS